MQTHIEKYFLIESIADGALNEKVVRKFFFELYVLDDIRT